MYEFCECLSFSLKNECPMFVKVAQSYDKFPLFLMDILKHLHFINISIQKRINLGKVVHNRCIISNFKKLQKSFDKTEYYINNYPNLGHIKIE